MLSWLSGIYVYSYTLFGVNTTKNWLNLSKKSNYKNQKEDKRGNFQWENLQN